MAALKFRGHEDGPGSVFVALFLLVLVLIPACRTGPAEARSFKTIFDHYRDRENVVAISFPPGLMGIFLSDDNPDQAELKELMQDLSSFRMLSITEGNSDEVLAEELRTNVSGFTSRNEFQDLFRYQTGEEDIFIRILEKEGTVREAILMLNAEDSFFVIDLRGNISLDFFLQLAEGGHLQELTSLADIEF